MNQHEHCVGGGKGKVGREKWGGRSGQKDHMLAVMQSVPSLLTRIVVPCLLIHFPTEVNKITTAFYLF